VPKLDVIICDEGHRLKNVGGTKTIAALSQCRAKKRLLLTGTPIQNDLDELFSVVSFVAPGFLGTLPSFKAQFAAPILRGKEPDASEWDQEEGQRASEALRDLLSQVMLRRTQAEILRAILPPRTDYVLYCSFTESQRDEYAQTENLVRR
jgi:DNA repair and recombination protein RAD54B